MKGFYRCQKISLVVNNTVGLHARPATILSKTAQSFESEIKIEYGEKIINAKSLISILSLGVEKGSEIIVEAIGVDADEALKALKELEENNFGE